LIWINICPPHSGDDIPAFSPDVRFTLESGSVRRASGDEARRPTLLRELKRHVNLVQNA
jgi:hypothetical protein